MTQLTTLSLADTLRGPNWESSSGSRGGVAAALAIGAMALGAVHVISKLTALQQLALAIEYCQELPSSLRRLQIHSQPHTFCLFDSRPAAS